jgi:hypothetical protein
VEYSSGLTTVFNNQHMATQTYIIYCCSNHGKNNCQFNPNRNGLVTLQGKSKQKKECGIGVATGASDVVLEVHYPNKSNSVMQQNANKKRKM